MVLKLFLNEFQIIYLREYFGINIGPNKDTENKDGRFLYLSIKLYLHADYITINISSPNTEGLRDFHER